MLKQISDGYAHVALTGPFMGKQVSWDLHLYTLDTYYQQNPLTESAKETQQFMHIEHKEENNYKITVGLAVAEIIPSVISNSVIMIQRYKKLHIGWHYWGAAPGISRTDRISDEGLERLEKQLNRGAKISKIVLSQWVRRYGEPAKNIIKKYNCYSDGINDDGGIKK